MKSWSDRPGPASHQVRAVPWGSSVAMNTQTTLEAPPQTTGLRESTLEHLAHVIEHAAHVLPAQGPITVIIHHNTLHAFEHLPFEQAVEKGARVFGCQPYLTEDRYRDALGRGRIRFDELRSVLEEDVGERADETI